MFDSTVCCNSCSKNNKMITIKQLSIIFSSTYHSCSSSCLHFQSLLISYSCCSSGLSNATHHCQLIVTHSLHLFKLPLSLWSILKCFVPLEISGSPPGLSLSHLLRAIEFIIFLHCQHSTRTSPRNSLATSRSPFMNKSLHNWIEPNVYIFMTL